MVSAVINADDFGLSDGICESIMDLLDASAISSTTIMVAAPGALDRVKKWKSKLGGVAGVHLQLTSGCPIAGPVEVPSLVDHSNGFFLDPRKRVARPELTEVELEWRRQIELVAELLGTKPTHLDSHHGMHRMPGFLEIYAKLALEWGIPVRGGAGNIGLTLRSRGVPSSVAIVRQWSGNGLGPEELKVEITSTINANLPEQAIEIVTHPGYCDAYLKHASTLNIARESEHNALLSLAQEEWLTDNGLNLTGFSVFSHCR